MVDEKLVITSAMISACDTIEFKLFYKGRCLGMGKITPDEFFAIRRIPKDDLPPTALALIRSIEDHPHKPTS